MQAAKQRDTAAELALRSELDRLGLRYVVDKSPIAGIRSRADVVFEANRVAVFVDGCFWHGCPEHGTWPKANGEWWREKIETNRRRDTATNQKLTEAGWKVIRVWSHEDTQAAADQIARMVFGTAHDREEGTCPDSPLA